MTTLLEYLDLLCDAWEAKLLHAERSFLTYLTHFIVLCVYPEKYTPPQRVWHPGLSGPSRTIARWLRDAYKTNLSKHCSYEFSRVKSRL